MYQINFNGDDLNNEVIAALKQGLSEHIQKSLEPLQSEISAHNVTIEVTMPSGNDIANLGGAEVTPSANCPPELEAKIRSALDS